MTTLETYLILSEALTSIPKIESFAIPLTFLALLVNDFRKFINVIVIIISGLVATFGFNYVPYKAYVIVAGVTALLTAAILTKLNKKNE